MALPTRLLALAAAGVAACLVGVGGVDLWQAAAALSRAATAQEAAAAAWTSDAAGGAAIARISDAARGIDLYVMPDAGLDSLADGPGLFAGVTPGAPGLSVIAGHRETHFAFLRDLGPGDRLTVEDSSGVTTEFAVVDARVVDGRTVTVDRTPSAAGTAPTLMLVTCWPFDSAALGPERYVVTLAAL